MNRRDHFLPLQYGRLLSKAAGPCKGLSEVVRNDMYHPKVFTETKRLQNKFPTISCESENEISQNAAIKSKHFLQGFIHKPKMSQGFHATSPLTLCFLRFVCSIMGAIHRSTNGQ